MTQNSHQLPENPETSFGFGGSIAPAHAEHLDPDLTMAALDIARARFRALQDPVLRGARGQVMTPALAAQKMVGMLDTLPNEVR